VCDPVQGVVPHEKSRLILSLCSALSLFLLFPFLDIILHSYVILCRRPSLSGPLRTDSTFFLFLFLLPGEALNIDLDSFINDLFGLLPLLPFLNDDQGGNIPTNDTTATPTSELLFQSLKHVLFSPNTSAAHTPMTRITSFSTRLISIAPHLTNPNLILKILETIQRLLVRFPALDAHLDSEGGGGGAWYGLFTLLRHVDAGVAKEAKKVFDYER
jgi:hypothetical protein